MLTLNNLANANISYIEVRCVYNTSNNTRMLDFTAWIDSYDSLNITCYRVITDIEKAYDILDKLAKRGVPSNYYITQLRDERILLKMVQSREINTLDFNTDEVFNKITFKCDQGSLYDITTKFINETVEFYDEGSNEYYAFNDLVLNKNNTNLSVRLYSKNKGFVTRHLIDIFCKKGLKIRALEPTTDIKLSESWVKNEEDNYYYAKLGVVSNKDSYYKVYINDEPAEEYNLYLNLSINQCLKITGDYFYLALMDKYISALYSYFSVSVEDVISQPQQQSNKTRYIPEKTILVEPDYKIPTIKKFKTLLNQFNICKDINNLDSLVNSLREEYGDYVGDCVRDMSLQISNNMKFDYLSLKILKDNIEKDLATQTVKTACLKSTLLSGKEFVTVFRNNVWYTSTIFRYCATIRIL